MQDLAAIVEKDYIVSKTDDDVCTTMEDVTVIVENDDELQLPWDTVIMATLPWYIF